MTDQERTDFFRAMCPPLYRESDPSRFPKEQFSQIMDWRYGPTGLLCQGDTGACKTRCVWALIKSLIMGKVCPVIAFDCVGFGHEVSRRFRDGETEPEDWLRELAEFKGVVFFDDLGKLKLTDRAEAELFGVIERRCGNLLPIFATTNDTGQTLADRMSDNRGPAMIRRLREFCKVVRF